MRDLNREAWFLYQVTSIEHFERCAQACQEFAEIFDQFMTKHDVHGRGNLDFWVQEYYRYARDIRHNIELVKLGDYTPMMRMIFAPDTSWRGMIEQILSWMTDEERKTWDAAFHRVSDLCGYSNEAMESNEWAGITWLEREERKDEEDFQELLDRDDGIEGGTVESIINRLQENGLLPKLDRYPQYHIDKTRSCRPGETCSWTGVWIPEPALTEGLDKFSLAFAVAGRPMQPVYRIVGWMNIAEDNSSDPELYAILGDSDPIYSPITKAEDALWYPVVQIEATAEARPNHGRLRAERNEIVPKTGWWSSIARPNGQALHYFEAGQHFPDWQYTKTGEVIWSYDPDQQPPPPKK